MIHLLSKRFLVFTGPCPPCKQGEAGGLLPLKRSFLLDPLSGKITSKIKKSRLCGAGFSKKILKIIIYRHHFASSKVKY
jgi:hypothetical protein